MLVPLKASPVLLLTGMLFLAGCGGDEAPDAYGTFEAEEVIVSAQTSGQIRRYDVAEGLTLDRGAVVGVIDTLQLALARQQVVAQRRALAAQHSEVAEQLAGLRVQHEIANRSWQRIQRLRAEQAATASQADQAERETRGLVSQMNAARAAAAAVDANLAALDAQVAQLDDRLANAWITNPVAGTVLTTYARAGEMIAPGQALYAIADLDTLTLRAYVSAGQLGHVRLGDTVRVHVDDTSGLRSLPGVISWVSDRAEFTPTPVQTRDERATLVYAVKIRVANPDGALKVGMPGDLTFGRAAPDAP